MLGLFIYRSDNRNVEEVFEIDQASWNNFMYVGCYARDIIKYLRQREVSYAINYEINNNCIIIISIKY